MSHTYYHIEPIVWIKIFSKLINDETVIKKRPMLGAICYEIMKCIKSLTTCQYRALKLLAGNIPPCI